MIFKRLLFIYCLLFCLPATAFSYAPAEREEVISETLSNLKKASRPSPSPSTSPKTDYLSFGNRSLFPSRETIIEKVLNEIEIKIGVQMGYLTGHTTYDFDHHVSELKFPLGNWMAGLDLGIASGSLSFNAGFWGSVTRAVTGSKMTDKDWLGDTLISSTESTAKADVIIYDASLRYDFYDKFLYRDFDYLLLKSSDRVKIGLIGGYRYERLDFDMYDLYDTINKSMSFNGQQVLTYKIEYFLPYLGMGVDVLRKNYGLSANFKYVIFPKAEDLDNHLLRTLTFPGDYERTNTKSFMFGVSGFWNLNDNWRASLGLDGVSLRIDGDTWEIGGDPAWNKDQFTDTSQLIFWSRMQYKF